MFWILEEIIGRILLESKIWVPYNPLRKIDPFKWQRKNNGEQRKRGYATQFSDSIAMQQGSDLEILHKGGNPVLQLYCFLLIPVLFGIIHLSLSFLILLSFLQIPIYQ
jgi:hypothetical protein